MQTVKNAKCNIIHSFCFDLFFFLLTLSIMSTVHVYLKSYHGILDFQLDDKEQKW